MDKNTFIDFLSGSDILTCINVGNAIRLSTALFSDSPNFVHQIGGSKFNAKKIAKELGKTENRGLELLFYKTDIDLDNGIPLLDSKLIEGDLFIDDEEDSPCYILVNRIENVLVCLNKTLAVITGRVFTTGVAEKYIKIVERICKENSKKDTKNTIYFLCKENRFYLEGFDVPECEVNVDLNYGSKFPEISKYIIDSLETKNKGLVILHGHPGTGKTYYIRHLIQKLAKKKVIYMPPFLTSQLSSPEFIPFMQQKGKNSVLIIEDAEGVVAKRDGANSGVSNLLNMSDGILADVLKCNIICTFNTDLANVDEALRREGRLIAEHEFGELNVEDAKKVAESLGATPEEIEQINTSIPLASIYNRNNKAKRNVVDKVIGFGK